MQSNSMYRYFMREFKATEAGPPQDVRDAFKRYAEGGTHMTAEQLRVFLEECQGGKAEAAEAENLVEEVLRQREGHVSEGESDGRRAGLSLDDFYFYLFATDLNPPIGDQVHQDMTKPISHYFIYTGHNSYLKGNQLSSDCSDVPIIRALKRGVRVIELDLWPNNANKEEIHVKHGGTLTTPVDLLTCLKAIKEHAFKSSPYPVVITLEDHLTPELQAKVAKMLTETFGDTIYCPECECLEELPSPEDLKYRVIISTKPPREYLKAEIVQGNGNKSGEDKDSDDDTCDDEPLDLKSTQEDGGTSAIDSSEESDDESCQLGVLAYKRLIAIHAGKPKGGLKEALKVDLDKVRRLSLSEQSLEKAVKNHGTDTIRFTQKNILRVYPKGTRFTSSNYKPLIGWMHGAQMVAFNMQGYGKNLWLMHGMFRSNGGCGYVKKPDFLMTAGLHGEVFNPRAQLPPKKILKVKVYMGDGWNLDFSPTHFDSFSPPDFYARVGIAGVPGDTTIMQQTKTKNNKWTPIWDQEFVFPLTVPELALLRIEVWEEDLGRKPDFGGQTCLLVSELRQGIRAVPLYDRKGVKYNSVRLLMHFEFVETDDEVRK